MYKRQAQDLTLQQKLRAGHVRRWHIVAVARDQTIADHMHRVGVITDEILHILGHKDWDSGVRLNAMEWARVHDLPEVRLGDPPSNAKVTLRRMQGEGRDAYHDAEMQVMSPGWHALQQSVSPAGDCPIAGAIVKLAEMIEGCNYLITFGLGRHAEQVKLDMKRRIGDFLTDFHSAYGPFGSEIAGRLGELVNDLLDERSVSYSPSDRSE
jgi:5'-deoxynucleotidase